VIGSPATAQALCATTHATALINDTALFRSHSPPRSVPSFSTRIARRETDLSNNLQIHETPYEQAAATSTAYGAFSALFIHLGLDRLNFNSPPVDKGERVLIWGISSSFGSAASRIAAKAGYTVVGVASAQHAELATDSGAAHFADRNADSVVDTVARLGPFKAVLAAADSADDQLKIGAILQRQGGGLFLSTMGVRAGVELPAGVEGFFRQFLDDYLDARNSEFAEWVWWKCFEDAFEKGWLKPVPLKVVGGLSQVTRAWDSLQNGVVSGKRLIIRPDLD
jgi:NADPH:quinone reductase-like Zn-dependent oxidoreductase